MENRERENEKNACNAFIEILRKITGVEYCPESWPEKENRNNQDVEVILAPKDEKKQAPKIAVEHTIVEAYESQIAYVKQSYDIVEKINQRCEGKLPQDRFFILAIPPSLIRGNREEIDKLINCLSSCIPNIAKSLHNHQGFLLSYNAQKIWLKCSGSYSKMNGKIGRGSTSPDNKKEERKKRFHRAIEEKIAKLIKYKEKQKYATALLLEDVSGVHVELTDHWRDLIPEKWRLDFQLKIDYVAIFVSVEKEMIIGNIWKEKAQLYAEVPSNRRFNFHQEKVIENEEMV